MNDIANDNDILTTNTSNTSSTSSSITSSQEGVEIVGTSNIASNSNLKQQEQQEEMADKRYIDISGDSSNGYHINHHNIIIEENERLEHENSEIQEIYKQKGMEFQKKDLRYGYDSSNGSSDSDTPAHNNHLSSSSSSSSLSTSTVSAGSSTPSAPPGGRMREGSLLNLKKQGIVKEISAKFQTPDTASYTRPTSNNISIKERIINLKKEQEKRKQDLEAQQREKVIILSSDSSSIQVCHPSVLIDRMNKSARDAEEQQLKEQLEREQHEKEQAAQALQAAILKEQLDKEKQLQLQKDRDERLKQLQLQKERDDQLLLLQQQSNKNSNNKTSNKTPKQSNKKPKPSTPTSSSSSKKGDNNNKDRKSGSSSPSLTSSPLSNSSESIENSRKRRAGRELVTPSNVLKKNIQIYFTIPVNPIPVRSAKPNQLFLQPAQQFLKTLISNETDVKVNELITDIHSIDHEDGSGNGAPSSSLLNVKSLRVKAIKTSFEILFLMPNQSKKMLMCKGSDSIEMLKERLISDYLQLPSPSSQHQSKYGADSYLILDFNDNPLERSLVLNKCDFILDKRAQGLLPKLKVIEKSQVLDSDPSDELSNLELETIGKLIPNSSNGSWKGDEVDYFRRVTSRLRYESLPLIKGSIQSTLLVKLSPLPIPIVGNKILISVFLPITQVTKTLDLELNETADSFTNRLFTKNYSKHLPNVSAIDFILKVVGSSDYIHGPYDIRTFENIRNHIIQGTKPQLTLIQRPKPELDPPPFKPRFDFPPELSIDYSSGSTSGTSTGEIGWDQLTHISIREIKKSYRVKVMGSSRIPISCIKDEEQSSVIVSISLYHGVDCFSKTNTQPIIPSPCYDGGNGSVSVDWNEWLVFNNIDYSNLPIDARLSISVYSVNDGGEFIHADDGDHQDLESNKKITPIGWINVMITDYKYQLRQGILELSLWPGEFSNPLGTCSTANGNATTLILEFEEFNLPVIFPRNNKVAVNEVPPTINSVEMREFFELVTNLDPLSEMKPEMYQKLWTLRHYSMLFPTLLPRLMLSVPWTQSNAVDEAYSLLDRWPKLKPYDALELLDAKHANRKVREFGVSCLEDLSEDELLDILLQLVQVLKYEPFHDSKLSRFLLGKAILNRNIGHSFFWYLKSDLHESNLSERFGILLESYLYACGAHRFELLKQMEVINNLTEVAKKIKPLKDQDRREFMIKEFESIEWPKRFHLTLNPRYESNGLIFNKCKYMDSKKLPLRLSFTNTDMNADSIEVIFKAGDDLRQDMLTLQMIKLMDKLWQKEGLDLKLSPYGCISTGDMIGMIEVVLNSETTAKIQRNAGGATAAFKLDPIANWLMEHNKTEVEYQKAVDTFILSCAGYCVATYILGIGDRHNDNIMCTRLGRLFHIDFGHIMGNYKKKFGIKRERAPFVFTPDFCFVMGGKESFKFSQFVNFCCTAYNILRKNAKLFMNLFAMMVSTGIPELQSMDDLNYLKESFSLELSDEKAREKFVNLIHESLTTKTTQLNNLIHILAHQ